MRAHIIFIFPVFALYFLPLAAPLSAQQTPTAAPVARDPQAVAILRQSFAAMGGTNSPGIRSVVVLGEVTHQLATEQVTGKMSFRWGGTNKCRLDLSFDSYSLSHVVNGNSGTQTEDGVSRRLPYHGLINHQLKYVPLFSEVSEWADSSYSVSYVGLESLDGAQVHHIHLEKFLPGMSPKMASLYANISGVELYIDAATLLLMKRSQQVPSDADDQPEFLYHGE